MAEIRAEVCAPPKGVCIAPKIREFEVLPGALLLFLSCAEYGTGTLLIHRYYDVGV